MISFRAKLAVSDSVTPFQWSFIDSDYRLYTIGYSTLSNFPTDGTRIDIADESGCYYDENNAWLALSTREADNTKEYRFFFTDNTEDNYIRRNGSAAKIKYNGTSYNVFGFTFGIYGTRNILLLSSETVSAGVLTGCLYPKNSGYSIYGEEAFTSESASAFMSLINLTPALTYPITYSSTHSTVSGPDEAAVGDTVTVSAVPDVDYGITDQSSQIAVTCNDEPVAFSWDATNQRITFTMPDPS